MGLGRRFELGPTELKLDVQLLNAFNEDSHDYWQTLEVPPGDNYIPDSYIAPRRWMLRLGVEF